MDAFGDASGHLRGLLSKDCNVYVAAVVWGDRRSCSRCAKKAVRQASDVAEAKWTDMGDVQKRRMVECLADNDNLRFGYAKIEREQLQNLQLSHLLYQNVSFPPDWDLALEGYAYGEVLFEMGALDEQRATFTFDRVASKPQSEAVKEHVEKFVSDVHVSYNGSRKEGGIQAADCFAGAVAEDAKSDTDWLSNIDDDRIVHVNHSSIAQLEHRLDEHYADP